MPTNGGGHVIPGRQQALRALDLGQGIAKSSLGNGQPTIGHRNRRVIQILCRGSFQKLLPSLRIVQHEIHAGNQQFARRHGEVQFLQAIQCLLNAGAITVHESIGNVAQQPCAFRFRRVVAGNQRIEFLDNRRHDLFSRRRRRIRIIGRQIIWNDIRRRRGIGVLVAFPFFLNDVIGKTLRRQGRRQRQNHEHPQRKPRHDDPTALIHFENSVC